MSLYRRIEKPVSNYLWTICILTLSNRAELLDRLLSVLRPQINRDSVQLLWLGDNKSMSVGEKRNKIREMASGQYVSFIDDDDLVTEDYVSEVLKAIEQKPDVVSFFVQRNHNGKVYRMHRYSKSYGANHLDPDRSAGYRFYNMLPDHLCVWRRELALQRTFHDRNIREDHIWAEEMRLYYPNYSEISITKILYIYDYQTEGSETHQQR